MTGRPLRISILLLCLLAVPATAHDLFLKLADYLVKAGTELRVTGFNGTFTTSENSIARARINDLSLVGPAGVERLDTSAVSAAGTRTVIRAKTGNPGTYVLGLSLKPSQITLAGRDFNGYLREEGLLAVLEGRRQRNELEKGATERYAKHVKTIFQAGDAPTESYSRVLGYPAEIVPLTNPYSLRSGDTLRVRLLVNGQPAAGIVAIAGGRSTAGAAIREREIRADPAGIAAVALRSSGVWYLKFISMNRTTEPGIDYISQWATLTFGILPPGKKPR